MGSSALGVHFRPKISPPRKLYGPGPWFSKDGIQYRHLNLSCSLSSVKNGYRSLVLINHSYGGTLKKKPDKYVILNKSVLFHLRSYIRNSCFVFHKGFQTPRNNKALGLRPRAFIRLSVFGTLDEAQSTRFWYITWHMHHLARYISHMLSLEPLCITNDQQS